MSNLIIMWALTIALIITNTIFLCINLTATSKILENTKKIHKKYYIKPYKLNYNLKNIKTTKTIEQKKQKIEHIKEKFKKEYKTSQHKEKFYDWIQEFTWGVPLSLDEFVRNGVSVEIAKEKIEKKKQNDQIFRKYFVQSLVNCAPFSTDFMRELHCCLFHGVLCFSGMYREATVRLNNVAIEVPPASFVSMFMKNMECKYEESQKNVLDVLRLNYDIVVNQPFLDGNKTIARSVLNYELLNRGYCPLLFSSVKDKNNYISSLEKSFNDDNMDYFYDFMLDKMYATAKDSLMILRGNEPRRKLQIPTKISSHTVSGNSTAQTQKQKD